MENLNASRSNTISFYVLFWVIVGCLFLASPVAGVIVLVGCAAISAATRR
jgi:hypothetical protein